MSSVRFVFPKLKLDQMIRASGGRAVADLLVQANANLDTLKPTCRDELLTLLGEAEQGFGGRGAEACDQDLASLYAIAARGIGAGAVCGAPDVDDALGSFCDLINALQSTGRRDTTPLGVHLHAWRLLMNPDLSRPAAAAIVEGLRKVSAHYAQPVAVMLR